MDRGQVAEECRKLRSSTTTGELGGAIASIIRTYSPRDLHQLRWNFSGKIRDYPPEYKNTLEETITGHLHGTYHALRRMHELKNFASMRDPLPPRAGEYWDMVATQCLPGPDEEATRLRFLKFLLEGFCMFVQGLPGHPVGMPFPGGDRVEHIEGQYYCPVREKANDVDSALCPFCPARQTPGIGYLKPPLDGSRHRKQEYIQDCYEHHNFNG